MHTPRSSAAHPNPLSTSEAARASIRGLSALALAASMLSPLATTQSVAADAPASESRKAEPVHVVYHLTTGVDEATRAMANIRNHLAADPDAKISVVANGAGIDFALEGAKDARGRPFESAISELSGRGVQFLICDNTLNSRNISRDKIAMEAKVVPSGVAEAARLQRDGYVYLKP